METIKQKSNNDCLAAVTAMILKITYEEALDILKKQNKEGPPFNDIDLILVALKKEIYIGILGIDYKGMKFSIPNASIGKIGFEQEFWKNEYYIGVKSLNFPDKTHAIYFDGEILHDPSSNKRFKDLGAYEVQAFYPISRERLINKKGDIK